MIDGAVGNYITVSTTMLGEEMLVSARIIQKEICLENRSKDKNTAGDFIQEENEIDEAVKKLRDDLKNRNHQYTCMISTDNGTMFKNGEGTTKLTANVWDAGKDVTDDFTIIWSRDDVDIAVGRTIIVNAEDVSGNAVYRFDAQDSDGAVHGFCEVTVSDVNDGANGVSPIIIVNPDTSLTIKDVKGEQTTKTLKGEDGISAYQVAAKNGFLGTEKEWLLSLEGKDGEDGAPGPAGEPTGITATAAEPSKKYTGMLWKHTGNINGLIKNATYRWNGSKWELFLFVAENIDVKSLSAIAANLGTITAGVIENQDKNVKFDIKNGEYISKDDSGTSTIKIKNDNLDYVRAYTNARYYGMRIQNSGISFYAGGEELMPDILNGELLCGIGLDQESRDLIVWSKEGNREAILIDTLIKLQEQVFKYGDMHVMRICNASGNLIYGCWAEQFYRYPGYYGNGAPTDWAGVMGTFPISNGGYIKAALSADCKLYLMRQASDGTVQQAWTAQ